MIGELNWFQRTVRWIQFSLCCLIFLPLFVLWLLSLPEAMTEIDAGIRRVVHAWNVASANE